MAGRKIKIYVIYEFPLDRKFDKKIDAFFTKTLGIEHYSSGVGFGERDMEFTATEEAIDEFLKILGLIKGKK